MRVAVINSGIVQSLLILPEGSTIGADKTSASVDASYEVGVGGETETVSYSAVNRAPAGCTFVPTDSADIGWTYDGTTFAAPVVISSKADLLAYAAAVRYAKEVGGTTVNGHAYLSDRETQAKLTAAVLLCQVNPSATIMWKLADGSFIDLDAAGMTAVASAVGAFVQACFATEASVSAAIAAGTTTTLAQVDAAFAS